MQIKTLQYTTIKIYIKYIKIVKNIKTIAHTQFSHALLLLPSLVAVIYVCLWMVNVRTFIVEIKYINLFRYQKNQNIILNNFDETFVL